MATSHDDSRQHTEGVFSKSMVQQIQEQINYYAQPPDKEQLKQIVSQVLVDSLPELLKHPSVAEEMRKSTYKILSESMDQKPSLKDSDLIEAVSSVLRQSEPEVARTLATVAERAVERAFKERPIVYDKLSITVEAIARRVYEFALRKDECFEACFHGGILPGEDTLLIHSPEGRRLPNHLGSRFPLRWLHPWLFIVGSSGVYEFTFWNHGNYPLEFDMLYRIREAPILGRWRRDRLYRWEDEERARDVKAR